MSDKVKIAVFQLRCTANKLENFDVCKNFIAQASTNGAKMAFLPENFDFVHDGRNQLSELKESVDGELVRNYRKLAAEHDIYLSLGGFHRKVEDSTQDKVFNTHLIIDNHGEIKGQYDKLHLFDADVPNGPSLKESEVVQRGNGYVNPIETPIGPVGMGICYDLRFPEFSRAMRELSARVLTFPSAFTVPTGQAHWHILLRARAIENQCFVVAAAQEGQHNSKRISYGHSLVVNPWGEIVAEQTEPGPSMLLCDIDTAMVDSVRINMPVLSHSRWDLFPMSSMQPLRLDIGNQSFSFGPHVIEPSCVFYKSVLSYAFVNISPLVPGHVLVSPIRVVKRFAELSSMEIVDIYETVKVVAPKLAQHFNCDGLNVSQQDGPVAGQSVPHVHVHILPRKPGDFPNNDDVHKALQDHETGLRRKNRSVDERSAEAAEFRKLFY